MHTILQVRKQGDKSLSVTKPQLKLRSADSQSRQFLPSMLLSIGDPETASRMQRSCNGIAPRKGNRIIINRKVCGQVVKWIKCDAQVLCSPGLS